MTIGRTDSVTDPNNYYHKSWNGADGKYMPAPGGGMMMRWNDYTFVETSHSSSTNQNGLQISIGSTLHAPFNSFAAGWDTNLDNELLGRLQEKINGHNFNMLIALSQADQTAQLILQTARTLARAWTQWRHGNYWGALRTVSGGREQVITPKALAGNYLAFVYGWKPLIEDIYSAAQACASLAQASDREVFYVKANRKVEESFDSSASPANWSGNAKCTAKRKITMRVTRLPSLGVSLGLEDPASMQWENIPFSFVFDWFVPFGSFLQAVNFAGSETAATGQYLYTDSFGITSTGAPVNPVYTGCTAKFSKTSVVRYAGAQLTAKLPHPTLDNLNGDKFLKALALIVQRMG